MMGNNLIYLLGSAKLEILGKESEFLVAKNNFPGDFDGILGLDVMKKHNAVNNVGKNILTLSDQDFPLNEKPIEVGPQESKVYQIENISFLSETDTKHLLVTGKNITPGIVKNEKGIFIQTHNHSNSYLLIYPSLLKLSKILLQENETPQVRMLSADQHYQIQNDRFELMRKNTRLDHIPPAEADKIMTILLQYNDVFYLPGDDLPALKDFTHKINLDTATPIFTK